MDKMTALCVIITTIVVIVIMTYEPYAPLQKHTEPDCLSSYPDFCIPPGTPDLDCPDIPFSNFAVRGSDPHHFDRDNDGVGCESR